jgi:hypothetical protein
VTEKDDPMSELEDVKALKLSLDEIKGRAASLKDPLLNYLLDMTVLHLSSKVAAHQVKTKTQARGNNTDLRVVSSGSVGASDSQFCQLGDQSHDRLPKDRVSDTRESLDETQPILVSRRYRGRRGFIRGSL